MTTDSPDPHYILAHVALRQIAFANPVKFLAVIFSDDGRRFVADIIADITNQSGAEPNFTVDDIAVHSARMEQNYPCVVIEFPKPQRPVQAYFAAFVVQYALSPDGPPAVPPDPSEFSSRYFTLEQSFAFDDEPAGTVLGEWTAEGMHLNLGEGPAPTIDAFVESLSRQVK